MFANLGALGFVECELDVKDAFASDHSVLLEINHFAVVGRQLRRLVQSVGY